MGSTNDFEPKGNMMKVVGFLKNFLEVMNEMGSKQRHRDKKENN